MVESGNLELVFGALDLLSGKGGEKKMEAFVFLPLLYSAIVIIPSFPLILWIFLYYSQFNTIFS